MDGGRVLLGFCGRLWRLNERENRWFTGDDPDWFSKLKKPKLELTVASSNPRKWASTNRYKFECNACNGYEPEGGATRGSFSTVTFST